MILWAIYPKLVFTDLHNSSSLSSIVFVPTDCKTKKQLVRFIQIKFRPLQMYPSLLIWYSVVSYTVVSYPNLVVSNPSVNRFVPKPLIYSFPSLYTFIQNTSRASVSTDVDCCVVYFFLPLLLMVMNSFVPTKRNKKYKFLPMESRFCWNKYWKDAQTSTNPWSNEVKAITTCCDEV